MADDDATSEAPAGAPELTTELDPAATAAATPLAYSDHTSSSALVPYDEGHAVRARWWPVVALVAAILAVTGGAAGVILWLGHRQAPAMRAVAIEPEVTQGPLNGIYRFEWHDGQGINRMADGSVQAVPADWGVDTRWIAIRSSCEHGVCTGTRIQVDGDSHSQSDLTNGTTTMTLINGQWVQAPTVGTEPCDGRPGTDTWETSRTLTQLPDGTLTGQEVLKVTTNECGVGGMVRTTPISATRTGDVPATVEWND
jgi:serine/threonine-protein kinase